MTRLAAPADEQLDSLFADYLARIDRGEQVDVPALCADHPAAEAELRDVLQMAQLLQEISQSPESLAQPSGKSTVSALEQPTLVDLRAPRGVADTTDASPAKPPGVQFGRYYLLSQLGEGSMGTVHLAYDTALDRLIALKTPRFPGVPSPAALERFRREARASAVVRHPNICPIFDVGTIDGTHYLSMAYIEGESLAQVLERGEPLPIPRAVQLVRKIAEALAHAHAHDVIHRDLKPANIMLDARGEPIITDFGLARRLDMRETLLTQTGMLIGTLAYMSPEQLEGNADHIGRAADIYSLGIICYQLLTGRLPYTGGFLSVVLQIRAGQPQPPSELRPELNDHPGLEHVCLKMMAGQIADRYASMDEVVTALAKLPGELPSEPVPPPIAPADIEAPPLPVTPRLEPATRVSRERVAIAAMSTLALILLIAVGLILTQGRPERQVAGVPNDSATAELPSESSNKTPAPAPIPVQVRKPIANGGQSPALAAPARNSPAGNVRAEATKQVPVHEVAFAPDFVEAVENDKRPQAAVPSGLVVKSRRGASEKFGIVCLEVSLPADGDWQYRPDWSARISSADARVFYPTYHFEIASDSPPPVKSEDKTKLLVHKPLQKLTAFFLTYGEQPLKVDLAYGGRFILRDFNLALNVPLEERSALLDEWWAAYTAAPTETLNDEARLAKTYLHDMLARRMHLPRAKALPRAKSETSLLQGYFEQSIGTFLGFDSVNVALGERMGIERRSLEPLDQPLPAPPRIQPVPFPPAPSSTAIEAIALHVPDDCVYLRCHSLENYLWFRDFLLGWGGGLEEVVSPRRLDRQIREGLERQLALAPDAHAREVLKPALEDMAVVFGDTNFEDGAAVGVLFQARDGNAVGKLVQTQRSLALKALAAQGATEQTAQLGNDEASLISTSDKRLRSFYASSGKFHFVTNSEYLMRRFFDCSRGERSLGKLAEFRYARTKVRLDDAQDVFLYMPDPFFQRIIGPHDRIELARRQQAKADVQHLELARLAAHGEGYAATRVDHLVSTGFLPTTFAERSDGSHARLGRQAEDSLRGVPGTFVPVCDMHVSSASRSEVEDYHQFSWRYRSEYRMMDPVAVVASHRELPGGRQEVDLEITITPYALQTYAPVEQALSAPQKRRIVGPPNDLLSLQASMKTPEGHPFLALASVHDAEYQFRIVDGAVQVDGLVPGQSFASENWQLTFNRKDAGCLHSLANILGNSAPGVALRSGLEAESLIAAYVDVTAWMLSLKFSSKDIFKRSERIGEGWQVRAARDDLQQFAYDTEPTADTKQVRFELKPLQGAKIEPYIQAYTFLEARRASARQAVLLELMMQQFCLAPEKVEPELAAVFGAKILCPLDGRLEFTTRAAKEDKNASRQWLGSRWQETSLYDETTLPADYRFAFTQWLRSLNVGFALDGRTLSADVQLQVQPRSLPDVTAPGKRPALQK